MDRPPRCNAALRRAGGRQVLKPTGLQPCLGLLRRPSWPRPCSTVSIAALQSMSGSPPHAPTPRPASHQCQPRHIENPPCQRDSEAVGLSRYRFSGAKMAGRLNRRKGYAAGTASEEGQADGRYQGQRLHGSAFGTGTSRLSWSAFPRGLKRIRAGEAAWGRSGTFDARGRLADR